jgi:predicted phage terminase large subunit-like protein
MTVCAPKAYPLEVLRRAKIERERRRNMPRSPAELAERVSKGRWRRARHLGLLNEKLVALAEGKIKRLIVTMPPRHGKSQLCSRYFPAWFLGKYPEARVILCSYEAGFAANWGGQARDVLHDHGPALFGVGVSDATSARDDWRIDGREGGMVTAGVGGPITGRGANLLIIDDPVKNARDANSPTVRDATFQWWQSTALTRLEPDASVLLIQTRWHKGDLAGRLMEEDRTEEADDEAWEVLNLPALAEGADDALGRTEGEALWPERWPLARLLKRMRRLGRYVWGALFQQRPTDPEGNYFQTTWFEIVDPERVPEIVESVRCWDLAATIEGEGGNTDPDYLASAHVGRGVDDKYYIFDVTEDRLTPEGVGKQIQQYGMTDGRGVRIRIEQEGAASGKIVAYHYERMMDGWDCRFTGIPKTSKFVRSGPFNAACERGDVKLVRGKWNRGFLDQLAAFPNGSHDDKVDAGVGAYEAMQEPVAAFATGGYVLTAN